MGNLEQFMNYTPAKAGDFWEHKPYAQSNRFYTEGLLFYQG